MKKSFDIVWKFLYNFMERKAFLSFVCYFLASDLIFSRHFLLFLFIFFLILVKKLFSCRPPADRYVIDAYIESRLSIRRHTIDMLLLLFFLKIDFNPFGWLEGDVDRFPTPPCISVSLSPLDDGRLNILKNRF